MSRSFIEKKKTQLKIKFLEKLKKNEKKKILFCASYKIIDASYMSNTYIYV